MPTSSIILITTTTPTYAQWYLNPDWWIAAGTLLLAYFAFKALDQIKIAKMNIETQASRESAKYATELIDAYLKGTIPLVNETFHVYERLKAPYLKKSHLNLSVFTREEIRRQPPEVQANYFAWLKFEQQNQNETLLVALNMQNNIEAFATPFVSKVANEKIAFDAVGLTFVDTIETYYANYASVRSDLRTPDDAFDNTIHLYNLWSPRLRKNKLETLELAIKKEIESLSKSGDFKSDASK